MYCLTKPIQFERNAILTLLIALFILPSSCTKVPISDQSGSGFRDYPLVEIEINNTPWTLDDYVYTTAVTCRARIINSSEFSTDIPVRLKNFNLPGTGGPRVTFKTTAPTFNNEALLDLPADGSWGSFEIIGNSNNVSVRDKDVVIELVENRPAPVSGKNVVLSRIAVMVTNTPPAAALPQFELIINNSKYQIDDYATLSPLPCRIRLINHASFANPVNVTLSNYASSVGKLRFATENNVAPVPHATMANVTVFKTAVNSTLNISVPADGSSVNFFIAGQYVSSGVNQGPRASITDKDAIIEVKDTQSSALYGRWGTMVRIRKNANTLDNEERDRFLNSLSILNAAFSSYESYIDIHEQAAEYNHSFCLNQSCTSARQSPSFLPWHRTFVLRIEQDLQAIDPSVALPYWKYDEPAPNVFHPDFMGRFVGGASITDISPQNPLFSWTTAGGADIRRRSNYNDQTQSPTNLSDLDHFISGGVSITNFDGFRQRLEGSSHGQAHNNTGNLFGMIRDFYRSPADPLFYLLHANVDRIWAKWQSRGAGRYEPENTIGYSLQGSFPSPPAGTAHVGSYALDQMWPWNGLSGTGTLSIEDYPSTSYASFPVTPGNVFIVPAKPRPFDAIDYRTTRLGPGLNPFANKGLGYDYNDEIFVFDPTL